MDAHQEPGGEAECLSPVVPEENTVPSLHHTREQCGGLWTVDAHSIVSR